MNHSLTARQVWARYNQNLLWACFAVVYLDLILFQIRIGFKPKIVGPTPPHLAIRLKTVDDDRFHQQCHSGVT
jgi:hypothetical protein